MDKNRKAILGNLCFNDPQAGAFHRSALFFIQPAINDNAADGVVRHVNNSAPGCCSSWLYH
jgi:hypothetical protein